MEKLNVILKDVKEHDSTLFQSNGLALKQGDEFADSFNVKQTECIEAKLTKVTQDIEALENKKSNYNSIFKGILKQHINKRRRKKENHRKSNERKRKRTENNVQRVYGICAGNDLPQCSLCTLLEQPSRKSILKLRMLPRRYLEEIGHTSHRS